MARIKRVIAVVAVIAVLAMGIVAGTFGPASQVAAGGPTPTPTSEGGNSFPPEVGG